MKIRPVEIMLFDADRHDEANSRISQFCELVWKLLLFVTDFILTRAIYYHQPACIILKLLKSATFKWKHCCNEVCYVY